MSEATTIRIIDTMDIPVMLDLYPTQAATQMGVNMLRIFSPLFSILGGAVSAGLS